MSKKTLEIIKNSGNDAIIQVKDNQRGLFDSIITTIKSRTVKLTDSFKEEVTKSRNRIEQRRVRIYNTSDMIWTTSSGGFWQFYIKEIIEVKRIREILNTKSKQYESSTEVSYYISTYENKNKSPAKDYNKIIRNHWGIENRNHHVKDETFKEDRSRIRNNPQNMAKLRSFALNIFRHNKITNISQALYRNAVGGIKGYII